MTARTYRVIFLKGETLCFRHSSALLVVVINERVGIAITNENLGFKNFPKAAAPFTRENP